MQISRMMTRIMTEAIKGPIGRMTIKSKEKTGRMTEKTKEQMTIERKTETIGKENLGIVKRET